MSANVHRMAVNAGKEDYKKFSGALSKAAGFESTSSVDAQTIDFSDDEDDEEED